MKNKLKENIKQFLPPIVLNMLRKNNVFWRGSFSSWKEASELCSGYGENNILEKVDKATSQVVNGAYPYERDSVLFNEIQYSWPVLSGLLLAGAKYGRIHVLDFGGSLGSSYYQNKKFLSHIEHSWNIVEQNNFVELGKSKYQTKHLFFYESIEKCLQEKEVNTLFISSTLQYLEDPIEFLNKIISYNFPIIILDRISIIHSPSNRLTIQSVPSSIYKAKYPCWFFNDQIILEVFKNNYELLESFDSFVLNKTYVDGEVLSTDKGYIFINKTEDRIL